MMDVESKRAGNKMECRFVSGQHTSHFIQVSSARFKQHLKNMT